MEFLNPNSDNAQGGWLPSVGTTIWEVTDEGVESHNADTDYALHDGLGSLTMEIDVVDPTESTEATTVHIRAVAKITAGTAPPVSLIIALVIDGIRVNGESFLLSTSYETFVAAFEGDWNTAQLNGARILIETDVGPDLGEEIRVTAMDMMIYGPPPGSLTTLGVGV